MNIIKVSEIFYSLQGEGARAGEPSIFIRLQGCSAKNACYAQGVLCDTEFESGTTVDCSELERLMARAVHRASPNGVGQLLNAWIVWTGGEPLDQLNPEILSYFKERGYRQAVETSGIRYVPKETAVLLDWIVCSPKVAEHVLEKNFKDVIRLSETANVDELRYVRHAGQPEIPIPSLHALYYYLSPHSDGAEINKENLKHCIELCLANPSWKLSVQQHKLWGVL